MKRQQYSLPTPSVHHRHRAVPLFTDTTRVERLTSPPTLSGSNTVSWTNNFTSSPRVTDRVQKAWGYNVGDGPIWELVEDRGWYKEAYKDSGPSDEFGEAKRRPRVYQDIRVRDAWTLLTREDAAPYLPTDTTTTDEGEFKPPPPLPCYFGPFGEQKKFDMGMFDTLQMSTLFQDSESVVFNAGAPVWGIDWCPIHAGDREGRRYKQYLAVVPFPSSAHFPEIGVRVTRPSPACIQIWSFECASRPDPEGNTSRNTPIVQCEMVICVDEGPSYELKWCPLPSHDSHNDQFRPRKLGLLGGTFEDGSFAIYAIPDPADMKPQNHENAQPIFVKLSDPLLRIELEETSCWTFDWANSELIAIGTTNGIIAVYNVGPALKRAGDSAAATVTDLLPSHYIGVHQSAIRALCWIRAPPCWPSGAVRKDDNPTVIASGGYDGVECLTDIREEHGSVMNRTRDVINTMTYSAYAGGPITIDHENIIKAYSASPSMLGRGHTLMDPQGPVWVRNMMVKSTQRQAYGILLRVSARPSTIRSLQLGLPMERVRQPTL
ncbi:hypothetical protein AX15_001702 [Amanita polypyramis BW_CC]|nr:hypothetical protein AX15_001702 [Amanita polypyramis BW_CC]